MVHKILRKDLTLSLVVQISFYQDVLHFSASYFNFVWPDKPSSKQVSTSKEKLDMSLSLSMTIFFQSGEEDGEAGIASTSFAEWGCRTKPRALW